MSLWTRLISPSVAKSGQAKYTDFGGALTVTTSVDSNRHNNIVTTDYGNKAMARPTDQVKGVPWLQVGNQGAEYGALKWQDKDREIKLGDRFDIYCSNLDMSTNCYDRYYVARGEQIVDVWPHYGTQRSRPTVIPCSGVTRAGNRCPEVHDMKSLARGSRSVASMRVTQTTSIARR